MDDLAEKVVEAAEFFHRYGIDTYLNSKGISRDEWRKQVEIASMVPFNNVQRIQVELLMGIAMRIGEEL